jgi:hypothetical protein
VKRVLLLALALSAVSALGVGAEPPAPREPYSCQLLYDEQRKCAFGSCDRRVVDRLTRECLRDGGRT